MAASSEVMVNWIGLAITAILAVSALLNGFIGRRKDQEQLRLAEDERQKKADQAEAEAKARELAAIEKIYATMSNLVDKQNEKIRTLEDQNAKLVGRVAVLEHFETENVALRGRVTQLECELGFAKDEIASLKTQVAAMKAKYEPEP